MKNLNNIAKFTWVKKTIIVFSLLLLGSSSFAFIGKPFGCDPFAEVSCGQPVVMIPDALFTKVSSLKVEIHLLALTPSGETTITNIVTHLTDATYFQSLGAATFNMASGPPITEHAYRFIYTGYTIPTGAVVGIDIIALHPYNELDRLLSHTYYRPCEQCPVCPSRWGMLDMYTLLSTEIDPVTLFQFAGYNGNYSALSATNEGAVQTVMNWYIRNNSPTVADYQNMLDPANLGVATVPTSFCSNPSADAFSCNCEGSDLDYLTSILSRADTITTTHGIVALDSVIQTETFYSCGCMSGYCFHIISISGSGWTGFEVIAHPLAQLGLPAFDMAVITDHNDTYYAIAYAVNPLSEHGLAYSGSGNFNYIHNFSAFNQALVNTNCPLPCTDCIGSFAPDAGKNYLISAWVKEDNAPADRLSYTHPKIFIDFYDASNGSLGTAGPFVASGLIIDGWQRIEKTYFEPVGTADMKIRLVSDTSDCNFDDIRVYPFDGEMKTFVYDPRTLRLVSELDEQNYATMYEYDEEGKLVRVKKETERGVMTIKEVRTHVQKQ